MIRLTSTVEKQIRDEGVSAVVKTPAPKGKKITKIVGKPNRAKQPVKTNKKTVKTAS